MGRDGMISWPDELWKKEAEGVNNTAAGKATVLGLVMQLWQA